MIQQTFAEPAQASRTGALITPEAVAKTLGRHFDLYRYRARTTRLSCYGACAICGAVRTTPARCRGGTGVIAQCIADLFQSTPSPVSMSRNRILRRD